VARARVVATAGALHTPARRRVEQHRPRTRPLRPSRHLLRRDAIPHRNVAQRRRYWPT